MTGFEVRVAELGDETAVTRLLALSYGKLMPSAYGQALTDKLLPIIGKAQPDLLASGRYYLAATPKGEVIGAGGWSEDRPGSSDIETTTGHIRHVATHPGWIGRGVGRAIVDRCLAEARSMGIARFECYSSLNAMDFYARLGFKEARRVEVPMGGDLIMPAVLMERTL